MEKFCKKVKCSAFSKNTNKCIAIGPLHCLFTAKEFFEWMRSNGYKIVKDAHNGRDCLGPGCPYCEEDSINMKGGE